MYKFDLPLDTREANAIARRRNCEEQRKSRIFDAQTRQIGLFQSSRSFYNPRNIPKQTISPNSIISNIQFYSKAKLRIQSMIGDSA